MSHLHWEQGAWYLLIVFDVLQKHFLLVYHPLASKISCSAHFEARTAFASGHHLLGNSIIAACHPLSNLALQPATRHIHPAVAAASLGWSAPGSMQAAQLQGWPTPPARRLSDGALFPHPLLPQPPAAARCYSLATRSMPHPLYQQQWSQGYAAGDSEVGQHRRQGGDLGHASSSGGMQGSYRGHMLQEPKQQQRWHSEGVMNGEDSELGEQQCHDRNAGHDQLGEEAQLNHNFTGGHLDKGHVQEMWDDPEAVAGSQWSSSGHGLYKSRSRREGFESTAGGQAKRRQQQVNVKSQKRLQLRSEHGV